MTRYSSFRMLSSNALAINDEKNVVLDIDGRNQNDSCFIEYRALSRIAFEAKLHLLRKDYQTDMNTYRPRIYFLH